MQSNLHLVLLAAGVGGFVGATGGRFVRFVILVAVRFGWDGVKHLGSRFGQHWERH